MSQDPELRAHQEWLGYLQPVGLVVSPAALRDSQAHVDKNIIAEQETLRSLVRADSPEFGKRGEEQPLRVQDFSSLAQQVLGWEATDLAGAPGGPELPTSLEAPLPEYGETLKPTYAVPDPSAAGAWLMLIKVVANGVALDETPETAAHEKRWQASPQARFERLLRENHTPIGLLINGDVIRLVYAPRGESTGNLTFPIKAMCEVAGRSILAGFHMLLSATRLFTLPAEQRLPALLQRSRKYQNEVSTKLAEQVLRALNELMRGFQAANDASKGELLRELLKEAPDEVYGGLLTTLMRLIFILYAEDRGLLSTDPLYVESYSISNLFERLREDEAQYPDTMDLRYGAWTQILTLSRLIHDGGGHGGLHLPARRGRLFDPDAYPFLEGRPFRTKRSAEERIIAPRVADGVIFRVLQDLLLLDGDRLSYRSLDVEQIGSVYEAMMGFVVQTAAGASVGLKPDHVVVNLEELLRKPESERPKWLKEQTGAEVTGRALDQMKTAKTVDDLVAAFGRKVSPLYLDPRGLPVVIPKGALYLQPTEERRRSGSHYTPRTLTEPIVRTTLEPVLKGLGEKPTPEQILNFKVCDPAMGSGAFLVESCRYLAEALVEAWSVHGETPVIPPDQEPLRHASRLIAQKCLYGIDKNPFAVDLAKLSLWLATLAKDHPFTFLDHALRCGDSLVGLSRTQIAAFHWLPAQQQSFLELELRKRIERVSAFRQRILAARDEVPYEQLRQQLDLAEDALSPLRQAGDAVIATFFSASKPRTREQNRAGMQSAVEAAFKHPAQPEYEKPIESAVAELRNGGKGVVPFHWELEFPEVFRFDVKGAAGGGFDAMIGNPPFLGGRRISTVLGGGYRDWLPVAHEEANSNSDLAAHFYRAAFTKLRQGGAFGLIATNTIAQGDTRATGLHYICKHGGNIYSATRRLRWPGRAAVIVSVVHVVRGPTFPTPILDGKLVSRISAFLFHRGGDDNPAVLRANEGKSFQGYLLRAKGFLFEDGEADATPVSEMTRLVASNPMNKQRIFPYIGGEELNESPTHRSSRYVIDFGSMPLDVASHWPDLLSICKHKVFEERKKQGDEAAAAPWWQFWRPREDLRSAIRDLTRVACCCSVQPNWAVTFIPSNVVFSHANIVFADDSCAFFAILQSRAHELWTRFLASSMKDDLRYTPTDCFETFPFPGDWRAKMQLEEAGHAYYEFRVALMLEANEGLTATYNRFHNPEESDQRVSELRRLHEVMDRTVLDAYGWTDLQPTHDFLLDYEVEDEEGNGRANRKPWRYRWPDDLRDEVLARLLELNRQRAQEEQLAGGPVPPTGAPKRRSTKVPKRSHSQTALTFSPEDLSK